MIVFDASAVISAALKIDSIPERALLYAVENDVLALSDAVEAEIVSVLSRPKFARLLSPNRRDFVVATIRSAAFRYEPAVGVSDCRDPTDNKYLELALASGANSIVSGDEDLLILHPWREIDILRPAAYLARILC